MNILSVLVCTQAFDVLGLQRGVRAPEWARLAAFHAVLEDTDVSVPSRANAAHGIRFETAMLERQTYAIALGCEHDFHFG